MSTLKNGKRINFVYFDGVNSVVDFGKARLQEPKHMINMRSEKIGMLEKRGGYSLVGDLTFTANYGLTYFDATTPALYRISI